jgi:stearoyl-CoA desaturase (delta-9 desaturase)
VFAANTRQRFCLFNLHAAVSQTLARTVLLGPAGMPAQPFKRSYSSGEILSLGLLVAMHAACLLVFFVPCSARVVELAVAGYLIRMFAITAGYHRYFSHRSFKTTRPVQLLLAIVGTTAMQNGPLWWASWHRYHHRHTDQPRDPHSPLQSNFWHAHMGWILSAESSAPDMSNVADLTRFAELRFLDQHKWLPIIAYAIGCFAIAGVPGLVWGFAVSTILVLHATALINSLGHVWGTRRYATADTSRNNALLAVITLGEGWHNNHHHAMSSTRQGFFWWEFDPTYYVLRVLASVGVVRALREPSARSLQGPLCNPADEARSRPAAALDRSQASLAAARDV